MATVAVGRRGAIVARTTTDKTQLRAFLERDRLYAAYAICDLEEREFARTRWGMAWDGDLPIALVLEYNGPTPQPLFAMGRDDGVTAILRDLIRPRVAYVATPPTLLPAIQTAYRVDPGPSMVRMWVDRTTFRPYPATVQRILPVDIGDLNRLYQLFPYKDWAHRDEMRGKFREAGVWPPHADARPVAQLVRHMIPAPVSPLH